MAKKLWGGRFKGKIDPVFERFSSSIATDYRMAECDLIGSFLHAHVLAGAHLITRAEFSALKKGIAALLSDVRRGVFTYDSECEDIHTCLANALKKKAGAAVDKLQTCRSRNDQVVFDTKLFALQEAAVLGEGLVSLIRAFKALGARYAGLVMPGYTHLQHAQPVYFKDYCGAQAAMFTEDGARLECFSGRLEISLGSGALAGTPIPAAVYNAQIKKACRALKMDARVYGISAPHSSLATVSDRDFVIELLSILAIIGMHLSRLAEDLILWSSKEFDFIEVGDAYCTGSSLMPQKKNPDALELMRGAAGILYGNLVSVLTTMKGLPLAYNRDMQWDKQPFFSSLRLVSQEITILTGLLGTITVKQENIDRQMSDESLYATDLADFLVWKGVPFAAAHHTVGEIVQYAVRSHKKISQMDDGELKKFSGHLSKKEISKIWDPLRSASSKRSVDRR